MSEETRHITLDPPDHQFESWLSAAVEFRKAKCYIGVSRRVRAPVRAICNSDGHSEKPQA
jgi:hypothetical protein